MSWRDRLQPASFRGVPFHVKTSSGSGGRRVAVHEYPLRDDHHTEDLGRSAGNERFQALLIGADYDLDREALIAALESYGPGTLVHPHLGTLRIQVRQFDWTISSQKGGRCTIDVRYVLAGSARYPRIEVGRGHALESACEAAINPVYDSFEQGFNIDNTPAWVSDAATDQLNGVVDLIDQLATRVNDFDADIRQINGQIQSQLTPISDLASGINSLSNELSALVLQPRNLAMSLGAVIAATLGGFNTIEDAFDSYRALGAGFAAVDPVPTPTASRQRQADNQTAVQQLLVASASIEMARQVAITVQPFASVEQALETRDALLSQLDSLAESADDASYLALTDLATALIARIDEIAPGLGRVGSVTLQQSQPALVLAHRLYGDSQQADALAQLNQLSHPGFITAGVAINYLQSAPEADRG